MSRIFSKQLVKSLGGAAAAMLSAGALQAQAAGAGAAPGRRDSGTVTTRLVFLTGRTDSIQVLAHKIAQEPYGSQTWIELTGQLDSLMENVLAGRLFDIRENLVGRTAMKLRRMTVPKGYLGINAQGPTIVFSDTSGAQRYRFLAYQPIISVDLGSPADRAGIEPGDVLVGYNGVDLINHEFDLSDMIAPNKRVEVTVRRGGEVKEYALTAASAPEEVARRRVDMAQVFPFRISTEGGAGGGTIVLRGEGVRGFGGGGEPTMSGQVRAALPRSASAPERMGGGRGVLLPSQKLFLLSPNGLFGASLSNVDEELAKALHLKRGILVNSVPEETPAYRAGLRSGDVIVGADHDTVTTVGQLRDLMLSRYAGHSVELQVVRQQKVKRFTLSWPE